MPRRLPDEYFRQTSDESPTTRPSVVPVVPGPTLRPPGGGQGLPVVLVVACVLAAFLIGFAGVRTLLTTTPSPSPGPSQSAEPTRSRAAVPYTGRVRTVTPGEVQSTCKEGNRAQRLLDGYAETIWTCPGNGVDQSLTFHFDTPVELVGVRLVGGNSVDPEEAARERQITAVRWTFDDGSWASQPLAGKQGPQELRFPNTEAYTVTLTVVSATDPGGDRDQVSISSVEFLAAG